MPIKCPIMFRLLEFVKQDIKNIILNKRKVELARKLEDEVYENAAKQ
jgi:hypothetical protein